jgi:hypothetical protein
MTYSSCRPARPYLRGQDCSKTHWWTLERIQPVGRRG